MFSLPLFLFLIVTLFLKLPEYFMNYFLESWNVFEISDEFIRWVMDVNSTTEDKSC